MMRKVYLEGEMGERFGTGFQINAPTVKDVMRCVECNHPSFKKYLVDCHEDNIGFEVDVASNNLDYTEEMFMVLKEGDITITPIPAGSKSGGAKIFAAIALIALVAATGGLAGIGGTVTTPLGFGASGSTLTVATTASNAGFLVAAGGGLNLGGMALGMLAVNLGLMGLSQVMAPDPATDADQEQNYLFNGNQQNIVEGDPIPILYGQLRVPGQPVNFEVAGIKSNVWRAVMIGMSGQSRGTA